MMKTLFTYLILTLSFLRVNCQTINYQVSNDIIANPERGLQKYSKNINSSGNYNFVNQTTLTNWRNGVDKITVIYRYLMLTSFIDSDISNTYLANVQEDFNRIRNSGLKVIIRPTYTDEYINIPQPNKARILSHIQQLASVINTNKDVIVSVQAGFIGVYGEWYYTGGSTSNNTDGSPEFGDMDNISNTQWLNRKEIIDAMLTNFDASIPTQVRYSEAKRRMYGSVLLNNTTAFQNTPNARIGFYNDAFLNEDGDMGTYNISNCVNPVGSVDFNYIANSSKYLPMNGESNGLNPCNSGFRTTGANAVNELNLLNFSTLNRDYHPSVWDGWIASGHYNEILRNLGYRLQLNSTTINVNSTIDFNMNISNVGYGNIISQKKVYLVFRNTTGVEYKKILNVDARLWETTHSYSQSLIKDIPNGQYSLYLHIADFNLENRSEYSVRLANSDILFETSTGYNNLNQTITITDLTPSCSIPTIWNGTSWSLGTPTLSVAAVINGPYNTTVSNSFSTCNLIVNSNLTINNNAYVEVLNDITVNTIGSVVVKSGGKLIPKSDTSVCYGNVTVERNTTSLKQYDYTYWSSPVNTQINNALLPTKWWMNYTFVFETQNFYDIQTQIGSVITSGPDGQDDNGDAWVLVNPTSNFIKGKGYASMIHPNGSFPRIETVAFTGPLNTGIISYPLLMSANNSSNNDDYNLVGNPYSSSIFADDFINTNINNITGTLNFWTHVGTLASNYPGLAQLNFSPNDYAYYNLSGGVAAGSPSLFGGKQPSGYIASCQGFLVQAENQSNLIFRPSFMATGYLNDTPINFFRNTIPNKFWVSINSDLGLFSQTLINYNETTSLNYEKGWDFKQPEGRLAVKFYSIQDSTKYKIQSRGMFNNTDIIKIGYYSAVAETFTIKVDSIIGIENIYIKDNGVIHNLPYTFYTENGEYNDRFEIVFDDTLNNDNQTDLEKIVVYPNPTYSKIFIKGLEFKNYTVLLTDSLGKKYNIKLNNNEIELNKVKSGLYLLKIMLDNQLKTFKIIKL